jgi:hypothetical protein
MAEISGYTSQFIFHFFTKLRAHTSQWGWGWLWPRVHQTFLFWVAEPPMISMIVLSDFCQNDK